MPLHVGTQISTAYTSTERGNALCVAHTMTAPPSAITGMVKATCLRLDPIGSPAANNRLKVFLNMYIPSRAFSTSMLHMVPCTLFRYAKKHVREACAELRQPFVDVPYASHDSSMPQVNAALKTCRFPLTSDRLLHLSMGQPRLVWDQTRSPCLMRFLSHARNLRMQRRVYAQDPEGGGDAVPVYVALVDGTGSEDFTELVRSALLAALEAMPPGALFGLASFSSQVQLQSATIMSPARGVADSQLPCSSFPWGQALYRRSYASAPVVKLVFMSNHLMMIVETFLCLLRHLFACPYR